MDQGERTVKERNPREKASFFSALLFCFTAPILRKGRRRDLQEKDVYQILPKFQSEKLGNNLEKLWNKKKTDDSPRNSEKYNVKSEQNGVYKSLTKDEPDHREVSILNCLIRRFGCYYLCLGVLQLVMKTIFILVLPKAISKFVAFFQKKQISITKSEAYGYAFFIIGFNFINCIYNHNYQQLIMEYSVRVRTSLCSLIYRKALKLSPVAFSENSVGKVVTLMTKDVYSIDSAMTFLNDMWIGVVQTIIVTVMIYNRIGSSVFVGIGFFILVIPIQSYCGRKFSLTRLKAAAKAEERITLVQEALNAIKIIKMYTWEMHFEKLITDARMKETDKLKIIYYLKATILTLGGLTLKLSFFLLIITYTMVGQMVTAETVYFVQQCFFALRSCITTSFPMGISSLAELCAAIKRIHHYLNAPEYKPPNNHPKTPVIDPKIYLNKVSMKILDKEVLKSVSLQLEKGLLIVSGNIGSGKSSLLKTILNEYPISGGQITVRGTISYAPEEPWLFPSTIRQNILFGQPYNEKRFQEVLSICALTHDLNQFEKLDNTVVGDKGINLSKGQQARICLARAVYKDSDIYLLDDCLSALDAHVNKHVFKECIQGFLKDKLVILVNNNINNIVQVPTGGVLFMENGRTMDLDQQKAALDKRITYFIDEDNQYMFDGENEGDKVSEPDEVLKHKEATEPRRNLYYEENKQGSVLWKNYVAYYKYTGGIIVLLFTVLLFASCQVALAYSDKLLSVWTNIEPVVSNMTRTNQTHTNEFEVMVHKRDRVVNFYTIAILVGTGLTLFRSFCNFYFCTRAGRKLHRLLIKGLLFATMTFYDNHFIGNIVNRVSKDFHTIDEVIPFIIYENLRLFFTVVGTISLIASVNYYFLIPSAILFIILIFIQRYYMPTGRSLKRLEATTRSPMIGYISASLQGLPVVHASQEENILRHEFDRHQDLFTSAYYMNQCTVRTFAFSMDMMCIVFISSIVLKFAIFSEGVQDGDVGLAVSQAMLLTGLLQWAVRQAAEIENTMTSVERVLEYADAKPENKNGIESIGWPASGKITYSNVSLTYATTGEKALQSVSFEIVAGSKIGIVGRTGAGKSSIISVLFRLYDYDGLIAIDGVDIKTLPLDYLRSKIGIIPQDPTLFSGTIRSNIDPLNQYSDEEIWSALDKVQMKNSITRLNQPITDQNQNYSSGQKQLICLARALISKNKIIVLDEATANMDSETDQLLQKTIQDNFADCTLLTIAHRLHSFKRTDRILVVEDGRIVQFDTPNTLLADKNGLFYKMVQDAGGINSLYFSTQHKQILYLSVFQFSVR